MKKFLPTKELIVANDKLSKALFTLSSDIYTKILSVNYKLRNQSGDSGEGWRKVSEGYTRKTRTTPSKPLTSSFKLLPSVAPPSVAVENPVSSPKTESKVELENLSPMMRAMVEKMLSARTKDAPIPAQNESAPKSSDFKSPVDFMTPADFYEPLNQFDRLVLSACSAEFEKGNCNITASIIYRDICGKPSGKTRQTPTEKQILAIMKSVYKLSYTKIKIRVKSLCSELGYIGATSDIETKWTPILPCTIADGTFYGKPAKIIKLKEESPVMKACKARVKPYGKRKDAAPIIRLDKCILDTGKNSSEDIISLKFYAAVRVIETMKHNMTHSITFADVLDKCNLTDLNRYRKFDIRKALMALMDNLKQVGVIQFYELVKQDEEFYSIKFE